MVELEFANIKASYQWEVDRFHHRISVRTPDGWLELLTSTEGTSQDPWPISPPWQQIVRESLGHAGEDVLLGVGLSGSGHWSIAVHPTNTLPVLDSNRSLLGLAFDIACKTSAPAVSLGSLWKVGPLWAVDYATKRNLMLTTHSPGEKIQVHLTAMHGVCKLSTEGSQTLLSATPETDVSTPQTHRWAIRIETERPRK